METIIILFVSALRALIKNPTRLNKLRSLLLPVADAIYAAFSQGAMAATPLKDNLLQADRLLGRVVDEASQRL